MFPVRRSCGATVPPVELDIRLLNRAAAERVVRARRDPDVDAPWADEYPLEGDSKACVAYLAHLPLRSGPDASDPFGYYQIVLEGAVVGGIGFHGRPRDGVVEVGYGVAPSARRQGVATAALRLLLDVARGSAGVRRACARTGPTNLASQRVLLAVGMKLVGHDPDFLHYELDLS